MSVFSSHLILTLSFESLRVVTWDNCARPTDPDNFSPQKVQEMGNVDLSNFGYLKNCALCGPVERNLVIISFLMVS